MTSTAPRPAETTGPPDEPRVGVAARARRPAGPTRAQIRRRRLVAVLSAVVLIVGLGLTARVLLYDVGLVDVEDVRVTGAGTLGEAAVLAAAAVPLGGPLLEVDTATIASRVAVLPAVARARVSQTWPHTVSVEVTERVAVAAVGADLVDAGGAVFPGPAGATAPELPRLRLRFVGPDDPLTRDGLGALGALAPPVRAQVRTVDVTSGATGLPSQVFFGLADDRQVRWGTPDRAADKAAVLAALLTQKGRVYDVTSPDLPTVRR